jgi:hypothetical protein
MPMLTTIASLPLVFMKIRFGRLSEARKLPQQDLPARGLPYASYAMQCMVGCDRTRLDARMSFGRSTGAGPRIGRINGRAAQKTKPTASGGLCP